MEEFGNESQDRTGRAKFRASSLGSCQRQILYKLTGDYPEEKTAREVMTLNLGTAVHEVLQEYIKRIPGFVSMEDTVRFPEVVNTDGHYDGLIVINGKRYLLEIKTSNVEAYQRLVSRPVPYMKHQMQATFYMKALDVEETIFLYVNKNGMFVGDFAKMYPDANPYFLEIRYKLNPKIHELNVEFAKSLEMHYNDGTLPAYKKNSSCDYCPLAIKEKCKSDRKVERRAAKEVGGS
jgi:CRISPR/Cas system-associated exonuclease Cas4 (RecB family)